MTSFLVPGLSTQEASNICMNECRAMCCRGPLVLELDTGELEPFLAAGARLQVQVWASVGMEGQGWIKFADHPGERCPMLDMNTFACQIYDSRPHRCREFPTRLTPGCAISGG